MWTAQVLNIGLDDYTNYEECPALMHFAWLIDCTVKEDTTLKKQNPSMDANARRIEALAKTIDLCKKHNVFNDILISLEREVSDAMFDILSEEEKEKRLARRIGNIMEERAFRKMIRKMHTLYNISAEQLAKDNDTTVDDIEFILTNNDYDLEKEIWWNEED